MEQTFKCSCYTHELHVELPDEADINLIEITMWSCGNETGSGWFFRAKLIWHVLTKGHCYKDMVCLQPDEANRLGLSLVSLSEVATFRSGELLGNKVTPNVTTTPATSPAISGSYLHWLRVRVSTACKKFRLKVRALLDRRILLRR